ncbi:ADP-ribosylation factor GTPase-activating protein glo3 isoform X3 [Senna tora]|uniref:ADP-ribosylation factor GTPase-activating protein glo3 isoform X3 n=1 Tax=Senna tora TaxID=362788 RepID=A0A835C9G9_9FABA|nr:ADP-ribosylation factor GTPase-activating protein glo3 isoform X3 [Senna tora]
MKNEKGYGSALQNQPWKLWFWLVLQVMMMAAVMGCTEDKLISELRENVLHIFSDFMTGIAKIDELGTAGSRLVIGYQQALEYIRRPPIDRTSDLINKIIVANETKRVKTYIEAGCRNSLDGVQNVNKTKVILNELEGLLGDVMNCIQSTDGNLLPILDQDSADELNEHANNNTEEMASSHSQNTDVTQLAALMGIIYSMMKQDYLMQERIISALNLKSSSGELESYCVMWSLRPFINDDIMHQAWKLIP